MSYYADADIGRIGILRAKLLKTHDDQEFQRVDFAGLRNQRPTLVGRSQPFGLTSHAPAGSIGHLLNVGGRSDQMWALGFEHPDHRPRNLGEGFTTLYNAHGDAISLVQQQIRVVTGKVIIQGDLELTGTFTHTGDYNQTGVHVDNNGPHTA